MLAPDDQPVDPDLIERLREQIRQIDSGEDEGIPYGEFFAALRAELISSMPKDPQ